MSAASIRVRCKKGADAGVLIKLFDDDDNVVHQFVLNCYYSKATDNFCRIPAKATKVNVTFSNFPKSRSSEDGEEFPEEEYGVTMHLHDDNGRNVGKRYIDNCKTFEVLQFSCGLPKTATVVFVKFGLNLRSRFDAFYPDMTEFN